MQTISIRHMIYGAFIGLIITVAFVLQLIVLPRLELQIQQIAAKNTNATIENIAGHIQSDTWPVEVAESYIHFKSSFIASPNTRGVLVDGNDIIVAATNQEWVGKEYSFLLGQEFMLGRRSLSSDGGGTVIIRDGRSVGAIRSFPADGPSDGSNIKDGFVSLEYPYGAEIDEIHDVILSAFVIFGLFSLAIMLMLNAVFKHQVTDRILNLHAVINQWKLGDYSQMTSIGGSDEIGHLSETLQAVSKNVYETTKAYISTKKYHKDMLNAVKTPTLSVSSRGEILYANDAMGLMVGYENNQLVGMQLKTLISELHYGLLSGYIEKLEDNIREEISIKGAECQLIHKDGSLFTAHVEIGAIDTVDDYVGIITMSDVSKQKIDENRLHRLAYYDILTGLPNANALDLYIRDSVDGSGDLQLLFLELEIAQFGAINSTFGYQSGDKMLQAIATRLSGKEFNTEIVARIEGDRFAVVFELNGEESYREIVERVKERVSRPVVIDDIVMRPKFRFGILLVPEHVDNQEHVLMYLNGALKRAKENRRTLTGVFSRDIIDEVRAYTLMTHELDEALRNNELQVYMQPQVDMKTKKIIGAEGLVRWINKEGKFVSPVDFIPVAEKSGLIIELGRFVMKEILKVNRDWHAAGGPRISTAINLSAAQFSQEDLVKDVMDSIVAYGVDASTVELELTESAVMDNPAAAFEKMERIRVMGVNLAIDDFGTGYSSLQYLRDLPVNKLKIDRSFINGLAQQPEQASIVLMVLMLADRLGMKTVAEGIEREEDADLLMKAGCTVGQGFYYYKPMPTKDFLELAKSERLKAAS